jgi:hypothetical protein
MNNRIENIKQQNQDLDEEVSDIYEVASEKEIAKTDKKRESYERLEQAKRLYNDELKVKNSFL